MTQRLAFLPLSEVTPCFFTPSPLQTGTWCRVCATFAFPILWPSTQPLNSSLYFDTYYTDYGKIVINFLIAALVCFLLFILSYFFSFANQKEYEKTSEYECGFEPFDSATRQPYDVHFYMVGILFLVFDVEIALLFPWAANLNAVLSTGFWSTVLFLLILTLGFVYEWERGALSWPHPNIDLNKTSEASFGLLFVLPMASLFNTPLSQIIWPYSSNAFLTFAVNFPVESLLGISLLIALLCLSLQLGTVHSFMEKKLLSLKWTNWLGFILVIHTLVLILCRGLGAYHGEVHFNFFLLSNSYITFLQCLVLITTAFVLLDSGRTIIAHSQHHLIEYPFLLSLSSWFLLILLAANHFLILIMGLVGFSVLLYVLIMMFGTAPQPMDNTFPVTAHEASIKYFYLSAFSSALILIAAALFYTTTRTLAFPEIQLILSRPLIIPGFDWLLAWKDLLLLALICYTVGFAFKLSSFPSHFWAPEVYEGSASPVTAFIIMAVKIATFGVFARTLASTLECFSPFWTPVLSLFAAGSLIVGALGAFAETRFKKFIAYSSINQIGFLLMGLTTNNITGYQSSILFLIIYIVTNIALFSIFLKVSSNLTNKPLVFLTDLTRLDPRRWILKFGFSCVFLSLAGLPPFAGFFGKLYILMNSLQQGDWVLVLLGVVTSLVSAYYYLRIVKALWFEKSESQEIFTDVISIPGNEFYSKPSQLKLFLALMFLTGFLLINKYMLIFSYHLAISCSFADAASWPSTINVL